MNLAKLQDTRQRYRNPLYFIILAMLNPKIKLGKAISYNSLKE